MKTTLLRFGLPARIFHVWREISALRASTPALRACAQDYARVSLESFDMLRIPSGVDGQGAKHRVETCRSANHALTGAYKQERRSCKICGAIGIALAMLALVTVPVSGAADPALSESRDDKSSPSSQFLTAYNSMSLADWLNEKGMQAEATDLYTEARDLFGKLAADYPQWQPAVVSFRINYCREALKRLQGPGREDRERRTTDDGRQTTESEDRAKKQTPNIERPTPNAESKTKNQEPRTKNKSQETSNATTLSPLNSKLQQAALRERGRDYIGALVMYIALLEEFPQEPWALKGACRCCLRLGRMNMARALIRQALALPSPDADTNLLAALIECNDGRYQEAITLLRQSLKQNFTCPEAHAALGVALASGGQMKEAQEEMKRALSLNPKLGDAYYNLARLSLRQKPTGDTDRIHYQFAIDTARVHYQLALRNGAAHDPELDKLLAE